MSTYGQFCPVAKAMEVLDERWTLLVVRELMMGSRHFNELRRGNPKMSPALLSKRLKSLERAGVVVSQKVGRVRTYRLVPDGTTPVRSWLDRHRLPAERSLDRLAQHLRPDRPVGG